MTKLRLVQFEVELVCLNFSESAARGSLDSAEAEPVRDIVDRGPAISVGPDHAGVGVARLVPGAVDVGVAEGEVLVLVLGVVLGGHHSGHGEAGWLADHSWDSCL